MADSQSLMALMAAMNGGGGSSSRGGYADLNNFQNEIGQNDYWKMAAAPIMGARFNTSTWTPGQTIGMTAGQAFLGAALQALGQRSEAQQMSQLAQVLPQLYKDPTSVALPEGMDEGPFRSIQMSAIKEQAARQAKDADSREQLFANLLSGQNPNLALQALPDVAKKFGIDPKSALGATGFGALPKEIRDDAQKELLSTAQTKQSLDYIDAQFEAAKKLTGANAVLTSIPGSSAIASMFGEPNNSATLDALGQSLALHVDKVAGHEINKEVREAIVANLPKPYDNEATLNRKREAFKSTIASLSPATPVLNQLRGLTAAAPSSEAPPPGYELTGRRDANGNIGIRKIR